MATDNKNTIMISDLNQKCLNLKQEIEKKISEIYKGTHNNTIDKFKEKVIEKYENYGESLKLLENLILDNIVGESQKVWKKYDNL